MGATTSLLKKELGKIKDYGEFALDVLTRDAKPGEANLLGKRFRYAKLGGYTLAIGSAISGGIAESNRNSMGRNTGTVYQPAPSYESRYTINASARDRCTRGGCIQGSTAVRKRYCQNAA